MHGVRRSGYDDEFRARQEPCHLLGPALWYNGVSRTADEKRRRLDQRQLFLDSIANRNTADLEQCAEAGPQVIMSKQTEQRRRLSSCIQEQASQLTGDRSGLWVQPSG